MTKCVSVMVDGIPHRLPYGEPVKGHTIHAIVLHLAGSRPARHFSTVGCPTSWPQPCRAGAREKTTTNTLRIEDLADCTGEAGQHIAAGERVFFR